MPQVAQRDDKRLDIAGLSPSFLADLHNECECQVCFQLFHEPVTSPCGHSFCRQCLARSYDHSDKCPLCRADLPPLAYFRWQRSNIALTKIIETALPQQAAERAATVKEEELALLASVPVFVCTTAWPGIKCFLHIFEPRYRLMVRRVLETPERSFGMVLPLRSAGPDAVNEYGTMLRVTSCQMLEDGRLILETIGTYRFRLLERSMVDGYNVGKVERVDDVSPEQEAELERVA
ncbi:PUA-like domain-containing protein, partial [Rhodotorula toruloides]